MSGQVAPGAVPALPIGGAQVALRTPRAPFTSVRSFSNASRRASRYIGRCCGQRRSLRPVLQPQPSVLPHTVPVGRRP
jgi:hypothetical protein